MFAYIEQDSYLHKRNPMMKFFIIIIWTFVVSMSYFPVLPILVFLIAFVGTWKFGKIPLGNLLRRLTMFITVSIIFMISMLFLRGLGEEPGIILRFWFLQWTERDIVHAVSLGFRILAFVTLSMSFVLTTRPRDLVLSIIMQCKVPVLHGYAAMATYRFLPELQSQVDMVHLAQEIRGIPWNRGVASRFTSPFRVMLPLFCVAFNFVAAMSIPFYVLFFCCICTSTVRPSGRNHIYHHFFPDKRSCCVRAFRIKKH